MRPVLLYILFLCAFSSLAAQSQKLTASEIAALKEKTSVNYDGVHADINLLFRHYWQRTEVGYIDSLIKYAKLGLRYAEAGGDEKIIADQRRNMGDALLEANHFTEAQKHFFLALEYYERTSNYDEQIVLHNGLCFGYFQVEDFKKALFHGEKGAALENRASSTDIRFRSLEHLPMLYCTLNELEKSLAASKRMLALVEELKLNDNDDEDHLVSHWYIAYSAIITVLGDQGKYEEAVKTAEKALQPPEGWENELRDGELRARLAFIQMEEGHYAEAVGNFMPFLDYMSAKGDSTYLDSHLLALGQCYQNLGQPDSALHYYQHAWKLQGKQTQDRITSLETELGTRYQTQEKEQRIATQESQIATQQLRQNITYGGAGVLALGLIGLLFGLRNNRRKNALLAEQNTRNELLLKEIHHRVKNNLETVSSLLELQSAGLTDEAARDAMQAGQGRVQSMGLLHQKLYQGKNLAAIEMKDYFQNLALGLLDSYDAEDRIKVSVSMQPLELDVDTAVPLGLIVNELLTNTIKYAFEGAAAGAVEVELSKVANKEYLLSVADNGQGKNFDQAPTGTGFGSRLVKMLTSQLRGQLIEVNDGGLRTELRFPERR